MTLPLTSERSRVAGPGAARAGLLDALVTLLWFAVAGAVGAVVWWQVTTLPEVTRSGNAASLTPEELTKQVNIDGWFFVIALVGGLASSVVLLAWRHRDPLLMVVLVTLGGALAMWLMVRLGLALGPGDEVAALRKLPEGGQVPTQLKLHATGVQLIWPLAAALGAVVQLWVLRRADDD